MSGHYLTTFLLYGEILRPFLNELFKNSWWKKLKEVNFAVANKTSFAVFNPKYVVLSKARSFLVYFTRLFALTHWLDNACIDLD